MTKLEDRELIIKIRQGEKEFFSVLVEKYYNDIFRFCYYKTGNEEAAYDCTQDTFQNLVKYFNYYVELNHFKAYLFRIARNACIDYFRKNPIYMEDSYLDSVSITEKGLEKLEIGDQVQRALDTLPDFQKDVVILHYYYDFKLREIAKMIGISLPTAKSRLKQGLDKLRKKFRKEDFI